MWQYLLVERVLGGGRDAVEQDRKLAVAVPYSLCAGACAQCLRAVARQDVNLTVNLTANLYPPPRRRKPQTNTHRDRHIERTKNHALFMHASVQ